LLRKKTMSGEITATHGPSCEVYRDLNENHFKYKEGGTGISPLDGIRFHYVEFNKLRDSAGMGCRLCRILQQSTSFFWGDDTATLPETSEVQSKDGEQSEVGGKSSDSLKSENRRKSEELMHGKQSRKLMRIEIRPEQSLLVTRISYTSANGSLSGGMRIPLEFYTKLGMYYTFKRDSLTLILNR